MKNPQLIPFSGDSFLLYQEKAKGVLLTPQLDTALEVPASNTGPEKATEAPRLEKKPNDLHL